MTEDRATRASRLSRRGFLAAVSATAGMQACGTASLAQQPPLVTSTPTIPVSNDPTRVQGLPFSERGIRSPFVDDVREMFGSPDPNIV